MNSEIAVVKSNKLIETGYKLGSREQFFILFLISRITPQDTEFKEYRIHYKDIAKLMNFDGRRRVANKDDVFKMMNNLNTQPIRFTDGDEDVQMVWISKLRYNKPTQEFTFTFDSELKAFLLQLKEHFTLYNISNIAYLSGHSTRIYEVLKRHQYKKTPIVLSIKDLKFWLQIEDKYPEYYEFKRWVLEPSRIELEQYTDIRFTYTEAEKEGKKILSLQFTIFDNEPKDKPTSLNILASMSERLSLGQTKNQETIKVEQIKPKKATVAKTDTDNLTYAQFKAFQFLQDKGVNGGWIVKTIFADSKTQYEPLKGYEDIYLQLMWQFFESKSKSKEPAGAFVNWYKDGKLTDDSLHARFIEGVIARVKQMTESEQQNRLKAKDKSHAIFKEQALTEQKTATLVNPKPQLNQTVPLRDSLSQLFVKPNKLPFDIEKFKAEYTEQYQKIFEQAKNDYIQFYKDSGLKNFDIEKNIANIEHRASEMSEMWYKDIKI